MSPILLHVSVQHANMSNMQRESQVLLLLRPRYLLLAALQLCNSLRCFLVIIHRTGQHIAWVVLYFILHCASLCDVCLCEHVCSPCLVRLLS